MQYIVVLLLFLLFGAPAAATHPSDTTASTLVHSNSINEDENALDNDYRLLQAQEYGRIVTSLADTPIDEWTGMQWLAVVILLVIVSLLFNCLCSGCCRRRYYRTPYYNGQYGGGYPRGSGYYGNGGGRNCCSCSDLFWCLCCFEWCFRDCQDVDDCCRAAGGSGMYQGGEMV